MSAAVIRDASGWSDKTALSVTRSILSSDRTGASLALKVRGNPCPGLNGANWEAVSALLDELLELDDAQRAARLAQLRMQNPALSDEVAELLARQGAIEMEAFLEGSAVDPLGLGEFAGRSFGGYTLDRPLGEGGMGSVWLARRSDGRYEGQAAVKLLNLASLGPRRRRATAARGQCARETGRTGTSLI